MILNLEQLLAAYNASDCMLNPKSFKNKSKWRWEVEIKDRANIFLNKNGKLIYLPNSVIRKQITENYRKLQKQHEKLLLESECSVLHSMRAIAHAHANTRTTSLICVKSSTHHFCLWHLKWKKKQKPQIW